ncbi:MAG: polyphosphate polymerase domain-containing protein [Lachnospiraceae bacterium]|nr:polyphosphate polymerase domain-containing protein [Lachnospiraceae bacterium]
MSEYKEVFKRTEVKYLLSKEQFDKLFPELEKIAKIDKYGKTRINNIYYDTPNYELIRTSLEKPMYKEKLRLRTYGETKDDTNSFIEIKKKYDGIVYKRRISAPYRKSFNYLLHGGEAIDNSQISKEIAALCRRYPGLQPAMTICYDRIAMAGIEDPDFRVTFDTNIRWNTDVLDLREIPEGTPILNDGEYMMEIKVASAMPLSLSKVLSELEIFPASFSKYGRGYTMMICEKAANMVSRQTAARSLEKGVIAYAD